MNAEIYLWITIVAGVISMASATASQTLHQFGAHELEEYCRKRNRRDWFGKIIERREWMTVGAESLRVLNTVVAICAAMTWLLTRTPGQVVSGMEWAWTTTIIALTLLVLNSWIPFAVAQFAAPVYLFHTWRIWWTLSLMAWPLIAGSHVFAGLFQRAVGAEKSQDADEEWLEDEIRSIVSEGEQDGLLESDERDMIEGVMELDEKDVFSVMTPRSKVDALNVKADWAEAVNCVVSSGRTRIPVYRGKLDDIIGVLFAKDLLKESLVNPSKRRSLDKLVRDAITVPESIMLNEMLQKFLREFKHLAIVVDEYGAFSGIVTIEDILEEIVGEIVDETDVEEPDQIQIRADGSALADGLARVDEINERLETDIPEDEDFDTIAGWIMHELRRIPTSGTEVVIENIRVKVVHASKRMIERVQLTPLNEDEIQKLEETNRLKATEAESNMGMPDELEVVESVNLPS